MRAGPRVRRLLLLAAAVIVLRGTQAAVAVITVLTVGLLHLEHPVPHLHVTGLAELRTEPLTPLTALVMVVLSAALAGLLLRVRRTATAFAGIKAFALVASSAISGVLAAGPVGLRLAAAGCGAALAVVLWRPVRRAAATLLARAGLPHATGRTADLALALKIVLLVAFVVVVR
jgi:hypothetical protein